MSVEYRVLGPLEVLLDGEPVVVPAGRGRVLLATLLLRPNEFVPTDELVERLWEGEPPALDRAHKTLQMVVARLRHALGAANCVRTVSGGYQAEVDPQQLDLTRFRRLAEAGEHRAALDLWRGPVLGDVISDSLHRDDVPLLVEEQIVVLEHRIDDDLDQDTDVLVAELRGLVKKHPLRETFWAQLMLALHRSDRQAEALAAYEEVREHLANELGVDPGARLREAHRQVLAGEQPRKSVPRQLPAPVAHFVGRKEELARLTSLLDARPDEPVLISAINGVGGVGKTALALQWAHQVAHRFPDGQVYVNLRGFDSRAEPVRPVVAIRDVLAALGVEDVPQSEEALVARYRSELAPRRVLVVLDNARDTEQVRPLLPGGGANLVLITSRNQLRGLVAREGARPVALDVLDDSGALDLLAERVGVERVEADPEAAARLVARCAGLPLALGIVAARAAYQDSLASLADELESERLDALDVDDTTGVRAVFSWSLRSLGEDASRLFVLLGLHPGPDFAVAAAASLAGLPLARTRRALGELVAGSLVSAAPDGRFALHDLLRDYARERVAELPDASENALRRMLDHYVHTTVNAWQHLELKPYQTTPPAADAVVLPIADLTAANDWYAAELRVLTGVLERLVATKADENVMPFVRAMHLYLLRRGHLAEAESLELMALDVARRRDDIDGQVRAHGMLASVHLARRELDDAEVHLDAALRLQREVPDGLVSESNLTRGLAVVHEWQGRYADALEVLLRIHPRIDGMDSAFERAAHLQALGRAYQQTGDGDRGLDMCLRAEAVFVGIEGRDHEMARVMNYETMGDIHLEARRFPQAVAGYGEAVRLLREMGDTYNLAEELVSLAKAHIAAEEVERARELLTEAVAIYEGQQHPDTAAAQELLASVADV